MSEQEEAEDKGNGELSWLSVSVTVPEGSTSVRMCGEVFVCACE